MNLIKKVIFIKLFLIINFSYCQQTGENKLLTLADQLYKKGDSFYFTSNYDSALISYKEAYLKYSKAAAWADALKCQFQLVQTYQVKGFFDSSFSILRNAEIILYNQKIDDNDLKITYYYLLGTIYNKVGEIDSSLYFLNLSNKLVSDGSNDSLQVLVKRSLGNVNYSKGKYAVALKLYKEALDKETKRKGSSEIMIAALFQNIGIIYTTYGDYDTAQIYLNKSIEIKEKALLGNDPQLAIGYLNYGRFLYVMGYLNDALDFLSRAEEIYVSVFGNEYFGLAPIFFNKGSIFISLRDLNKALEYHERALVLYRNNINQNNPVIGDLIMNIGVIHEKKGDFKKAIQFYEESLAGTISTESLIKSYKSIARCHLYLKDTLNAEINFKLSINKAEKSFGTTHYLTAGSYKAYGEYLITIKKYKKAEWFLTKAYDIWLKNFGNKSIEMSTILSVFGDLYNNLNEFNESINYYQKAIIAFSDNFANDDIFSNPTSEDFDSEFNNFSVLYKKSYSLYNYYIKFIDIRYLECSFETCKLAIELFETIQSGFKDEDTKILINDYVYDIYNLVVLIASDLYNLRADIKYLNAAYEFAEKGKAAILLSSLRQSEAIEFSKIPPDIRSLEQNLNKEISILQNFIFDESQKNSPDSSKLIVWKKRIFNKKLTHDSLISAIERNYPEYYNLKYNVDVAKIEDVQKKLKKEELLIEYKIIDSILITFSISENEVNFRREILENDFKEKVLAFISSINQFPAESFNKENYIEFIYRANDLYHTLLKPSIQSSGFKKIIIVPDEFIGYLPFEALIDKYVVPERIDFKNLNYLLKSYIVSYSYSGTLLYNQFTQSKSNTKLLAMAPTYNQLSENQSGSFYGARDVANLLNTLEFSEEEVNKIISVVKGKIFKGEDATENNFKREAEHYGILHFAMHTLINDDEPMTSKLVFTLTQDSVDDGFLNAYEIYNLKLKSSLAVLSACKTGVGKLRKGEGFMSLARAFLYAGVPTVIMTLWEVEDVAGSEIMYIFYKNLKAGKETDLSLREAKLSYLESSDPLHSHPYFWAAYVQIGKTEPIITKIETVQIILASIALLLISIFLYRKFKKTKEKF